jgi:Dullard-like phosphatase family protein
VNSDFLKKQKKSEFNNNNNTIEIDKSKRTINGNENRILARFSFFNYFKKKNIRNELNKDMEKLYKSSDKLKLVTNNSCKNSVRSKYKNRSIVNLRTLSINNLDLSRNNNENIYNSYLMLKSSGNEVNNEERKRIKIFNKKFYIIHFFEEIIDITNSINDRNLLKTLLNNLNIKYYLQNNYYDDKKFNNFFKENENFEYVFKHFGLVLICLIFFVNDNTLYNENNSKAKDLLIQLIYSSLNYVEIFGNKDSSKIYNFISKFKIQSKLPIRRYIISLILFLFDNKKEYIPLKNALEQLYDIIIKKDYKYLTEVLNNCILYCYNSKPKNLFSFTIFKSKSNTQIAKESQEKQNNDTISHNNNNSRNKNIPPIPFIRTSMKKKFCLVLDIDETISHSLKLSFGYYFLVRPGAIYFLKEVSKYYEIIIFTSSPKNYADNILNKIDISGNLISHRLYRNHVVFENGKSVKNLNKLGRDLTKTIFIDNLRSNAKYNLHNLCSIKTWISDIFDDRLIKLKDKLIYIATCGKYDDDITQGI